MDRWIMYVEIHDHKHTYNLTHFQVAVKAVLPDIDKDVCVNLFFLCSDVLQCLSPEGSAERDRYLEEIAP